MKVITKKLAVRASVDENFLVHEWLKEGDTVTRVDDKKYYDGLFDYIYYKVRTKGGTVGYVRRDAVK